MTALSSCAQQQPGSLSQDESDWLQGQEKSIDQTDAKTSQQLYANGVNTGNGNGKVKRNLLIALTNVILLGSVLLLSAWIWSYTLRKQAIRQSETLNASRLNFQKAILFAPFPVIVIDLQGNILLINHKFSDLFGYTIDDISTEEEWWRLAYPDEKYRQQARSAWQDILSHIKNDERKPDDHQGWEIVIKDGSTRTVTFRMIPLDKTILITVLDITEQRRIERALRDSEHKYRSIIENSPDLFYQADTEGKIIYVSPSVERVMGFTAEELIGMRLAEELYADPAERQGVLQELLTTGAVNDYEVRLKRKSGELWWASIKAHPLLDESGATVGIEGVVRDVSERKLSEERLRLSASVFESTIEGVIITDANSTIIEVNRAFCDIFGYTREEVIGSSPKMWRSDKHDEHFYHEMWRTLEASNEWRGELWNRRKDGSIFPGWLTISGVADDAGNPTHYVAVLSDISNLKHSQEQLQYLAHHDALTGLPNRLLFNERLEQAILHAARKRSHFAVIFMDLDRFKYINDSQGHTLGDLLLKAVANRLTTLIRQSDTVARIGGDEFVLLLEDIETPAKAALTARKLMSGFAEPFLLDEHEVSITTSMGICIYPDDGQDADTLLRNTDTVMYQAKEEGRNSFKFYTEDLTQTAIERASLEVNLRRAVETGGFSLVYQPQIDLRSSGTIGVEALIRWHHEELGDVSPARFIPLAEECGLIHPIGDWVLHSACIQGVKWLNQGLEFGSLAVNISGPQIQRGNLLSTVANTLDETGFPAERLELEITEGFIMRQVDATIDQLNALRKLGVTLAIDDFGTGYSSLSHLKELPVHKLKIDRSFVQDIPDDPNDMAIADAIIAMSRSLKLVVIAEGVETEAQAAFLKKAGCHKAQGYFYSRPLSPAELQKRLTGSAPSWP